MDDKLDLKSLNIIESKIAQIKKIFPEITTEGRIDFEKLKLTLGEEIEVGKERYGMNWPGKANCFKIIQEPSIGTLKPVKDDSVNFDTTQNLFIQGDSLEVLKLLQKSYYGKVKMIYIDPPYNTGKDFVYPDNYSESLDTYLRYTGQKGEEGLKLTTNAETEGRYHSKWMNMMYPRLFLARNLLKEDGIIFISIDDNEVDNLRKVCNEILGEENFVGTIARKTKLTSNKGTYFAPSHEYILTYARNIEELPSFSDPESQEEESYISLFKYEDKYSRYNIVGLYQPSLDSRPNQRYFIKCPDGSLVIPPGNAFPQEKKDGAKVKPNGNEDKVWRWSLDTYLSYDKDNLVFKQTKTSPLLDENGQQSKWNVYTKIYLKDRLEGGMRPITLLTKYPNSEGSKELIKMDIPFDFPKPKRLLMYLAKIINLGDSDIVLDFFAGSCSTAHAVLDLNKEDGMNRKFIMVQLQEPTTEDSEAFKAGYKNIAEIGKERIRRVIKKIKEENAGKLEFDEKKLDLGFKVFRLDESNFKIWDKKSNTPLQKQLELSVENINNDSSEEEILYEIILKSGFKLSVSVEKLEIQGKTVYSIDNKSLLVCLENNLTHDFMKNIADLDAGRVVCLDRGFGGNDELKTNTVELMRAKGIEFKTT